MKKIIVFSVFLVFICCKSKDKTNKFKTKDDITIGELSKVESLIINDFLSFELNKESNKKFKNLKIFVIEEAIKKTKSLNDYEFNYKYKNSWGKFINNWILDSIQITTLKFKLVNEIPYSWKTTDFKEINVKIIKNLELKNMTNSISGKIGQLRPILFLSKPLMLNEVNALISFEIGSFQGTYNSTSHSTVLMTKVNEKWIENGFYEDGVFN
ncbi:MAG: hypothetical protein ACI9XR_001085 [Flavobacterium sp.]|jgi:hypothetical protein